MPLVAIPAIVAASAIGGGATIGASLIGSKSASNAAKKNAAITSPLIQQQTDASKFNLEGAKTDLPAARSALQGPLAFWKGILSGDRNQMSSVLGPENDVIAGRDALATRNLSEFAPRGGRRTLMLGDKPFTTTTEYNKSLLSLRPQAADKQVSIAQLLAQLGLGESSAATGAANSGISGALQQQGLDLQRSQSTGQALEGLGSGIGKMLQLLLKKQPSGSPPASSPSLPISPTNWPMIIKSLG